MTCIIDQCIHVLKPPKSGGGRHIDGLQITYVKAWRDYTIWLCQSNLLVGNTFERYGKTVVSHGEDGRQGSTNLTDAESELIADLLIYSKQGPMRVLIRRTTAAYILRTHWNCRMPCAADRYGSLKLATQRVVGQR